MYHSLKLSPAFSRAFYKGLQAETIWSHILMLRGHITGVKFRTNDDKELKKARKVWKATQKSVK